MKIIRVIFGLSLLLVAVNAFGQKVTTQSAPNVNWSQYKTYSWAQGESVANPIMNQYIVSAIDAQLSAKGFKKVDNDGDLIVVFNTTTDTQKQLNWNSFGGFGRWGGGTGSAQVENIVSGQLIVDLADPKTKQFLWRGSAMDTVSNNPEKNEKKITNALTKMFQKFPS